MFGKSLKPNDFAKQNADAFKSFQAHLSTLDGDELLGLQNNKNLGTYAREIGIANESVLNFVDDVDNGNAKIGQMDAEIKKLDKSAAGLGSTFKATAKTFLANMGAMLAISAAIWAVSKAWDHIRVTIEEQKEIVENLTVEVNDLQIAYDELSKSGNLTDAEQEKLNMLERQLEIKKELLALEQKELAEKEILQSNQSLLDGNDGMLGGVADNEIAIHRNIKALEEYREQLNKVEDFDHWGAVGLAEMEKDATEALEIQRTNILEQEKVAQDRYNLIKNHLDAGIWDDDPAEKLKWEKELEKQQGIIDELQSQESEISIALGVEIDQTKAKEYIKNQVQGIEATWLQTLSKEEITYLFRLEDIGKYSPEDLKDMIKDLRKSAEDPIEFEIVSKSEYLSDLEKTSDGFEKVAAIYNDVKDAGEFDFSSLAKDSEFYNTFQSAGSALEDFVDIVSNSPSDINACQNAFDELVTSWFYAQDPLKNITEETKDLTIAWLQQKGVGNAVEVATSALTRAKENQWLASKNLTEASEGEIRALIAEAKSANMSTYALNQLQWALYQTSKTRFSLDGQINEFRKLYLQVMGTVSALSTYEQMKSGKTGWVSPRIRSETLKNEEQLVQWKIDKDAKDALAAIDDFMPTGGGSSGGGGGGGGGGGSASEPWKAEIDKYEQYTRVIEDLKTTLSDLNRTYEHTDDIEERIALKQQEINLYGQQQKAIEDLNNARDEEIGANVNKLRGKGFKIDYDPLTDSLVIHNKELINTMKASDDTKQELWKLIEASEELNSANKESTEQWKELSYSILESRDALEELHNERFDKAIADAEHLIELFSKRGDVVDEDLQLMGGIMTALEKELQKLAKEGTEADKDRIKELQKMWMDYYDSRIERENEILEKQLEDRDGVLSAIDNLFNERIENIDKEIEALKKTNEERKSAIELQKAQAALDKANSQKTRKVLRRGVGWVYEADDDAIKEAEENLADLEFEQSIETLEKQKEALEELQNKWAEIPDEYEKYRNELLAEERLGADWEDDVLDGRISVFNDFKNEYFDIQDQIYKNTKELNEHMADEYQKMMDMFANMIAMFNMPKPVNKEWYVGKDGKAPKEANVGDIVYTKGGTYRIDAKDENGKFTSTKINDKSTLPPSEDLWGTEIKKGATDLTDVVGMNVITNQDLITEAEDVNERIKASILSSDELRDYMKKNTDVTQDDVDAILENADFTHRLSGETDDNTDATDDNTKALRDLIYKLANLELEVPIEEEEKMTLDNFDDSIMSESDQKYVDALQAAWLTAKAQGNTEMMEQLHALADATRMKYLDDDETNDFNKIAEETVKLAGGTYKETSKTQIGGSGGGSSSVTDKYLDTLDEYREYANKTDEDGNRYGSDEYLDRLDTVEAIVTHGSGLTSTLYEDENGRQSTIIEANNKDELKMSADEIKAQSANTKNLGDNTSAIGTNTDSNDDLSDTIKDATDTVEDSAKKISDAYSDFVSAANSNGSSGSRYSSSGSGGSSSKSDPTQSAEYKQYAYAKALAESQGNKEAADLAQANMDRITKGTSVSSSAGKSSSSKSSSSSKGTTTIGTDKNSDGSSKKEVGSYTTGNITVKRYSDGSTKTTITKKAKGGTNLRGDVYNVDEKGPELLIEPDEGRFVRIRQGGSVIPADVSKKLWEFGANPKAFMDNIVSKNTIKINPQIIDVKAAATAGAGTVQNNYHIDSIALPNVQDINGFIRDIQNLPNLAKQYMTKK